jgi:hypothetical protein
MKTKNTKSNNFLKMMQSKNGVLKMRKYIYLILALFTLMGTQVLAQSVTKVGTTSASFLGIDVGPRGTAMGGAYVSVANDPTAMYWNPAGISAINTFEATFSNTKWIADLSFNFAGIVMPLGSVGNIGINATFLTMDEIERTTILNPDGTGEFFDAGSFAIGLSYARPLTEQFSIGFNVKYINERLYHTNAHGFALDVGALFDTQFHGVKLGMSIANYGTKMQLDGRDLQMQVDIDQRVAGNNPNINARLSTDYFDLPLMFRFGVSVDILKGLYDSNLILSADALHPSDDVEYVNIGAEYLLYDLISLRVGYKELFAIDSEQGLNFGAGIHYSVLGATTLYFDYSYIDFGVFDAIHMYSVSLGL